MPELTKEQSQVLALNNPAVRDLAWACHSGLMFARTSQRAEPWQPRDATGLFPLTEAILEQLQRLDAEPSPLLSFLAKTPRRRLGLYFEDLIEYFLSHTQGYELLSRNLAVRDSERTLGEFDFIYGAPNGEIIHLEIALKFYLGHRSPHTVRWLGPGLRDELDKKLARMMNHQGPLIHDAAALTALNLASLPIPDRSDLCVGGRLFQGEHTARELPKGCNDASHTGRWLTLSDACAEEMHGHFTRLSKLEWLTPRLAPDLESLSQPNRWLSHGQMCDAMQAHFSESQFPQLFAVHNEGQQAFLFIVPNDWHDRALLA